MIPETTIISLIILALRYPKSSIGTIKDKRILTRLNINERRPTTNKIKPSINRKERIRNSILNLSFN